MSGTSSEGTQKLRQIYEKYKNRMYISACRVLNDPFTAEDAVHDAFIAISKHIDKIGDVDSVSTASYVTKAARNRAINMLKKNQRERVIPGEDIDEAFGKDTGNFVRETNTALCDIGEGRSFYFGRGEISLFFSFYVTFC